ncbi:MAG TPA: M14 family zinc carboxypeptidase [Thermoanaerobaculia bacterium]|nr:M14 family zinc carboxypeptidase [Thermoanaerobaculia bacterium]
MKKACLATASLFLSAVTALAAVDASLPARDPAQKVDEEYTKKIREYTTETFFLSPLVEYLPASEKVPTPKSVLGDVAGAPGKLPYSAEVYRYMRMLEAASPRVKVRSIGTTEEGREMIVVAVASEELLARMEENRQRLAKLADPRAIRMDDAEAERLVAQSVPIYYITGTIHSPETGAPTALMELAYRLAVDESPYVKFIRDNVITLITPVVEADGRDKQVDIYNWHLAHPKEHWPPLVYWGKYVAHDNNRDAMGLSLKLTRNVLKAFLEEKATLIHDLHESVPFLYDNTVGDGPYNAWLDPILTNEWQMLGWQNVHEMTRFGMPGVFTHGTFDTWSPAYLMFVGATHNGISRLYETFGNAGADTLERTLRPEEYARTWYRQNPPLPKVKWSQRDNNNYEQTGLLTSLHYFGENGKQFLRNFYVKSKRSIEKPKAEGPAAYVFTAADPRPGAQAELLRLLQAQGCEISRATAAFTATEVRKKKPKKKEEEPAEPADTASAAAAKTTKKDAPPETGKEPPPGPITRSFPAGSYVLRMDQPYSRIADMMLDYQYWSPEDPQKRPYDDTGWTFGEAFGVKVARVLDPKVLEVPMTRVEGEVRAPGELRGSGPVIAIAHTAEASLATLRYRFRDASFEVAEDSFQAGGEKFARGTFLVRGIDAGPLRAAASELGLKAVALAAAPDVARHALRAPRIALVHTWLTTQDEGWWRLALDEAKIPYDYINTQTIAAASDLSSKYDVILFPPVGRGAQAIVTGTPMWGNPLPWKTTALTPNIGKEDSTDDIRPGLGFAGLQKLRDFAARGGLVVGVMDTAELAVNFGLAGGVSTTRPEKLKVTGSILRSKIVDKTSPILYGYSEGPAIYSFDGPIFNVSNLASTPRRRRAPDEKERPTGRGTSEDPDRPTGRAFVEPPDEPEAEAWEALPLTDEQRRNNPNVIPPALRPRVVLRYGDSKDLLVSGLIEGGREIAQHAAVIDVPVEKGHIVLFSNNPIWRGETKGSYFLVYNAILNFDSLNAGRRLPDN